MNTNAFSGSTSQSKLKIDPRTKIVLLITVSMIVMCGGLSGVSAYIRPVLALFPFILLSVEKKFKKAIIYFAFLCPALVLENFFIGGTNGALNIVVLIYTSIMSRFVPGIMMGYYFIGTTKISELIAAMERIHMPRFIVIPFAVMIRFFPTIAEENAAISDAMRMRGVRLGGGNAISMIEYRFIPMMMSVVKIGEELSAAALTRGLGSPVKRTNICQIGIRFIDAALIFLCVAIFILWILF